LTFAHREKQLAQALKMVELAMAYIKLIIINISMISLIETSPADRGLTGGDRREHPQRAVPTLLLIPFCVHQRNVPMNVPHCGHGYGESDEDSCVAPVVARGDYGIADHDAEAVRISQLAKHFRFSSFL
jgi:hypothetical protein